MYFFIPISFIIIAIIVFGIACFRWIEIELDGLLTFMAIYIPIICAVIYFLRKWIYGNGQSESGKSDMLTKVSGGKSKKPYTFEFECPDCGCIFECDFDTSYIPSGTEVVCPDCNGEFVVED